MSLTIFGWIRKPKPMPPTVLELTVEEEIGIATLDGDRGFELITMPMGIPDVILRNENGATKYAKLWQWDIGTFWFNYVTGSWTTNLSAVTDLYSEGKELIAAGFNSEKHHVATGFFLFHGQRLRFHRVESMLSNSPVQFYPEVRVRICRESNQPRG